MNPSKKKSKQSAPKKVPSLSTINTTTTINKPRSNVQLTMTREQLPTALESVKTRHDEIIEIEKKCSDVKQTFDTLNEIVTKQGQKKIGKFASTY